MNKTFAILALSATIMLSCTRERQPAPHPEPGMYFPPVNSTNWDTVPAASLGWNEAGWNELFTYLQQKNTKAFIILKNGRIVKERYFGTFGPDSNWYWASAGKTMTAMMLGIAQEEGLLDLNDRTSQYLGQGWTSLPAGKEDLIRIRHQLTMTTGLDDETTPDRDCTAPACLIYKTDAGGRWAYHNAPYTLLDQVLEAASGMNFNQYFQQKIRDRVGMNGIWLKTGYNNVYFSNARSMARFGLLMQNKGKWEQTVIAGDAGYMEAQVSSSQNFNPSYGYLTWLNGKSSYMLPTSQIVFPGMLIPNAPADLYAALGKNDQKIYVVPSLDLVVIRMGESAGNVQLAVSSFDNELWGKLKVIIGY